MFTSTMPQNNTPQNGSTQNGTVREAEMLAKVIIISETLNLSL